MYCLSKAKKFIFILLCIMTSSVLAAPIKITFINPTQPNDPFWGMVTTFMQAAAHDLDIELTVLYSQENRLESLELAREALASPNKPDYLAFHFQAQIGAPILQAAENAKVHSFVFNSNIPEADMLDIGKPRDKYKYWLGHMFPDDENAGYILSSVLALEAIRKGKLGDDAKVHIVGLTGDSDNMASIERKRGVERFVAQRPDIQLHQIVNASWDAKKAQYATNILLSRYPQTTVVWAASDEMAFGAMRAIKQHGLRPGFDIFTGGIDWTPGAMKAIRSGEMVATLGGHFMEGGWVMVLLHDHYHALDFKNSIGTIIPSKMHKVTSENIQPFIDTYNSERWGQIDFKSFSKKYNTQLKAYQFKIPDLRTK
jgi:ABC-type sugar transport system substrate-binding protein